MRLIERNFPCHGKGCERRHGGLDAKACVSTTANQLPELRAKFKLANTAASELDIVLIILLSAKLRVQLAHAGHRVKIKVTTEYERRRQCRQRPCKRARCNAGLQPCNALPHAALRDKILLQKIKRRHHRAGVAVRPQSSVNTEHKLAINFLIKGSRDASGEQVERIHGINVRLVTNEHDVDVGGGVEFLGAQLAHSDR